MSSCIALDIIEDFLRHLRNIYISKGTIKMSTYPHVVLVDQEVVSDFWHKSLSPKLYLLLVQVCCVHFSIFSMLKVLLTNLQYFYLLHNWILVYILNSWWNIRKSAHESFSPFRLFTDITSWPILNRSIGLTIRSFLNTSQEWLSWKINWYKFVFP